jgi:hypothetical protein
MQSLTAINTSLNNSASFYTTVVLLTGSTMTGDLKLGYNSGTLLGGGNTYSAVSVGYLQALYLPLAGGTVSGATTFSALPLCTASYGGSPSGNALTTITYVNSLITGAGYAPIASPTFTGTVTIPSGAAISGYLTTASAASTYAPLANPTFTGTPAAPTPGSVINTTQIPTTAYLVSYYVSKSGGSQIAASGSVLIPDLQSSGTATVSGITQCNLGTIICAAGDAHPAIRFENTANYSNFWTTTLVSDGSGYSHVTAETSGNAFLKVCGAGSSTSEGTISFYGDISMSNAAWNIRNESGSLTFRNGSYSGTIQASIDASGNLTTAGNVQIPSGYGLRVNSVQVVGSQQTISISGGTTASGWTDSTAQGDFNALLAALAAHGLIIKV